MSIEKIAADYEACKDIHKLGLKADSYFSYNTVTKCCYPSKAVWQGNIQNHIPAYTVTEVPIPPYFKDDKVTINWGYNSITQTVDIRGFVLSPFTNVTLWKGNPDDNMATQLIKGVLYLFDEFEVVRDYYKANGYLEVNNERY